MKLTTKTDYCLRVLIYLQEHPGKSKIQQIAKNFNVSKNHLSVAVNQLSELGYVLSTPGPKGGVEFNPKSANKTVAELVKQVEEFNVVECFDTKTNSCNLTSHCRLKFMLKEATKSFIHELEKYQIKDLSKGSSITKQV